jgi:hypothetical protein
MSIGGILGGAAAILGHPAMRRESVYHDLKKIVDQLPQTKQCEAQWAEVRPEPPRHMNLALQPRPTHFGRLCRFRVGDRVKVCYQHHPRRVVSVECPEVSPVGWSHCQGNDAIYNLDDGQRRGDIELSFYSVEELRVSLPSGRDIVRVTLHEGRMIALVDADYKPIGAEDMAAEDWEFLFFNWLPNPDKHSAHA